MLKFANIEFRGLNKLIVLDACSSMKRITTVNAEFIVEANKDEKFLDVVNSSFATFDGQIPYLAAKLLNPREKFQKLSGSDLVYDFCEFAERNSASIFLLGGNEGSNRMATEKLRSEYRIQVGGFSPEYKDYPFDANHNAKIISVIKDFRPDILMVGFGAKKQELWLYEHREILGELGIRWGIGVGGTFDFVAGVVIRAPKIVQHMGLEGVWRLLMEPKMFRLVRLVKSLLFFKYIL